MKRLIDNYNFDASERIVQISGITFSLAQVLLITNVTSQTIIYNFADSSSGATLLGNTLTLEYNTTAMSDADELQIYIDIPEDNEKALESQKETTECLRQILTELKVISYLLDEDIRTGDQLEVVRSMFNQ